ncbi:MAG TPA: YdcH family protein [Bryobacteraceae bacterium]|nr:YdcH family protein [Bryobacteraceae bacterium]
MDQNAQEELKAHLMQTDEGFRRLVNQHSDYAHRLEELASRPHLSDQEQMEEVRLKKLKLHAKDQIETILSRYRAQHVA